MGSMERYTICDFNRDFPDDDACLQAVVGLVYPEGITCRSCGQVRKHHRLSNRKAYSCDYCGTHVYPLAGTIFEKSRTPLKSWFYAMYLMASTRCGISAKQLERELGVTYKTAWRMFKQIRSLIGDEVERMAGEVGADEAYVGGKRRGTPRGRPGVDSHKVPVVDVAQRGGKVTALVTKDASKSSVVPIVKEHVLPETMVYTDDWTAYDTLGGSGYHHQRIPHAQEVYVVGKVHTNTIEGFWSLLRRGIGGVYHSVSATHLQSYVNEYAFRYNHRADERSMFKALSDRVGQIPHGPHGTYSPVSQKAPRGGAMPSSTVTLALEGEVSLADFAEAMRRWRELLDALAAQVSRAPIEWIVESLESGSAEATARGESAETEEVERTVHAYYIVGQAMQDRKPIPYSPRVIRPAQALGKILNGRVTSLRFETPDETARVVSTTARPAPALLSAYGAVEGRVQTLTSRRGLRFTLFDALTDRAVTCYLGEGQEELMRTAWGARAVVEGLVGRDPTTGHPATIRNVSNVRVVEEVPPGTYRLARGAVPVGPEALSPEDAVRRVRDA